MIKSRYYTHDGSEREQKHRATANAKKIYILAYSLYAFGAKVTSEGLVKRKKKSEVGYKRFREHIRGKDLLGRDLSHLAM